MNNWLSILDMTISYGISGYILFKFLYELFRPKYSKYINFLAYILFVLIAIGINLLGIPLLRSIYGIFAACSISIVFFYSPRKRKIIGVALLFFLYVMLMDVLSVLMFSVFSGHTIESISENNIYLIICGLINQVLLLCFYRPILGIMHRHKFDSISKQQNIFLVILAFFEIAMLNYISIIVDSMLTSLILTILSFGFLGFDIYLIYLFEAISQKYTLENEMELRDQQILMQTNYYNSIEVQYDNSRKLIHDMKNHVQTLEELYRSGNEREASVYTKRFIEIMDSMGNRFKSRNRILEIIINDKILKCDEKRIQIEIEIEDLDLNFIESFDITTVFSNLLDNAIEASEMLEISKRKICIKLYKFQDFTTIFIENNCEKDLRWKKGKLISTKKGNHMGLGLKNVQSAVEKYGGTVQIKVNNEKFSVKILFSV